MCDLCNGETRSQEQKRLRFYARKLRRLADKYEGLADGRIEPHMDEAKDIGFLARDIVRELVESWV